MFYIYKGSGGLDHGLIVSKTESTAAWQTANELVAADRTGDGSDNMTKMLGGTAASPAANYVDGLSERGMMDWYLPSIDELNILWNNRIHVNKAMHGGEHTLLATFRNYWSSLELDTTLAYIFSFQNGGPTSFVSSKTHDNLVRGIRSF